MEKGRKAKALKRKKDKAQDSITQWKTDKVRSALDKAENVIEDLRISTITEKDIAWG